MSLDYENVKDLIESHTKHLTERADRADARIEKRLDAIDQQLAELCVDGCAAGVADRKRLDAIEAMPTKIGSIVIGLTTVVSSIVSMVWLLVVHLKGGK